MADKYTKVVNRIQHNGIGYFQMLKLLNDNLHPQSYFEIGSWIGDSLKQFTCPAVVVDPVFRIEGTCLKQRDMSLFFQMTSDEFFRKFSIKTFFEKGVDLAFLDGMHRFEYLLRDFINTEQSCHKRSTIMLHDCLPTDELMAERVSTANAAWAGDVWRMLPILKKYRPDMHVVTLDCHPTGLVLCSNLDPSSSVLRDKYCDIVREFFDMNLSSFGLPELWTVYPHLIASSYPKTLLICLSWRHFSNK